MSSAEGGMTPDLPFGFDPEPQEPTCPFCDDSGLIERGSQILPCCECRSEDYDYALEVGPVDP